MKKQQSGKRRGERWWRRLVDRQAATGERVEEVCKRQGVSTWSFYQWRKRLQANPTGQHFTTVELGVVNEYEVRCRNGRSVVVRGAVSPAVLASILSIAEGDGQ